MTEPEVPDDAWTPHLPVTRALRHGIGAMRSTSFDAAAIRVGGSCAQVHMPLTSALIAAGLGGLSMCTPGHRCGRLFGAWEAPRDQKPG